jgi:O-antigen ligase
MRLVPSGAGPPPAVRRTADALLVVTAAALPLSTTAMQAGIVALVALALVGVPARWGVVRATPLDGALAVFFGTLALSTLASGHPLEAGGWARPWVAIGYFGIFWWLRDRAHAARVVRVVVAAGALAAAFGILQHFTGADWYRALLGRPTMVRPRQAGGVGYATVGFFRNYLTFGHAMVLPLGWAAALMLRRSLLGLVASPLLVVAIVFSTARGAWLAMLAVLGVAVALTGRPSARGAGPALALVALAAGVAFVTAPDLRMQARRMFETGGVNVGRTAIYRANLDIVHDHPVLGLGFGRYRTAAAPYYARHPRADRRSHAHNNFLQLAAEAGLAGLAAFGLLYATAFGRGWPALAASDAGEWAAAAGAWAGVVGFLVGGLTQYNFGDNEVALAMWAALAVLMRCRAG